MTQQAEGDHPEAITLGLHDASPPHLVDAMANDVVLELGWGRLLFGQTFADADKLAEVLRGETHGSRDICIYAREPHVLVAKAPAELFIDPSHTYRLALLRRRSGAAVDGFHRPRVARRGRRRRDEPGVRALRDGACADRCHLGQPPAPGTCRLSDSGAR